MVLIKLCGSTSTVEMPVMFWHGTADQIAPIAEARVVAATVPSIIPHILDGEGHLSVYTRTGEMLELAG